MPLIGPPHMYTKRKAGIIPYVLHGHTRPINQVTFNADSDILFASSSDKLVSKWWSLDGVPAGTFEGHSGVIWSFAVTADSRYIVTGSGDFSIKFWDVETGAHLLTWRIGSVVKVVRLSIGDKKLLIVTGLHAQESTIHIVDFPDLENVTEEMEDWESIKTFPASDHPRVLCADWVSMNNEIVCGHAGGKMSFWNPTTGELVKSTRAHNKDVTNMTMSDDQTCFITTSFDGNCKLWDSLSHKQIRSYACQVPLAAGAFSIDKEYLVVAGGTEDKSSVTTTQTSSDKFRLFLYDLVTEELIGTLKGHIGPVNTIAISPDGIRVASGSEDGIIRMCRIDEAVLVKNNSNDGNDEDIKEDDKEEAGDASAVAEVDEKKKARNDAKKERKKQEQEKKRKEQEEEERKKREEIEKQEEEEKKRIQEKRKKEEEQRRKKEEEKRAKKEEEKKKREEERKKKEEEERKKKEEEEAKRKEEKAIQREKDKQLLEERKKRLDKKKKGKGDTPTTQDKADEKEAEEDGETKEEGDAPVEEKAPQPAVQPKPKGKKNKKKDKANYDLPDTPADEDEKEGDEPVQPTPQSKPKGKKSKKAKKEDYDLPEPPEDD
ncbi:putative Eukaryotic translation initiation factor 3 subunit I [Blattamonas nauphoetae]|uniref:Serine-threonine kinase receptor-associated protein n=1 Tax=Blattamonas nauphoetae TaxID=2049346 RepID=A0ABQ9XKY9_9EUKA|nr:putative Eukaryotic translation initiation factor 3 subunit I [Blattamonas nauphoetae]